MSIYLDNASLEKPKKEVIELITDIYKNQFYNPNSVYENGLESNRIIEYAKNVIALELGCNPNELIMCSGGSEANTLALNGFITKHENCHHFITSKIEHSSIINNPYARFLIGVDKDGKYNIDDIKNINNKLVCLSMANSEIGTIQDIKEIVKILKDNNCIVHVDGVASLGKMNIDVKDLKVDMLTITGQKVGGILGAACLYKKNNIDLEPIVYGHNLRSGTPNVAAIAGFGKAIELINKNNVYELIKKRDYLIKKLIENNSITVNGSLTDRLCNNVNICIHNIKIESQQLVALLDIRGFNISAGSACNSGIKEPSKVLKAIGLTDEEANRSIRITLSEDNTYEELDLFVNNLFEIIKIYTN